MQNIIIRNGEQGYVNNSIATATGSIPECLLIHYAAKRGIEEIY
jgi:hypothetical protein